MSDYTGPGIYEIIPHHAQTMSLNIWGGGPEVGTAVKIQYVRPYFHSNPSSVLHWQNSQHRTSTCSTSPVPQPLLTASFQQPHHPRRRKHAIRNRSSRRHEWQPRDRRSRVPHHRRELWTLSSFRQYVEQSPLGTVIHADMLTKTSRQQQQNHYGNSPAEK